MKLTLFYAISLTLITAKLSGQSFVKISNPTNPINSAAMNGFYRGAAWVDYDADGDLDLSTLPYLFRNEGNDNFTRIQVGQLSDGIGSVSWGDVDRDGDVDCLYGTTNRGTFLLLNQGNGQFNTIALDAGNATKCWSASLGEFNNDGNLDAILTVPAGFGGLTSSNFFYLGTGNGAFSRIDTFDFVQIIAPFTVSYWTDFDNDGDSDLFIASGPAGSGAPDYNYRNLLSETGTAGLQRIQDLPFGTENQDGQCYNFIDYDLDGDLDLFITNYSGVANHFYRNDNGMYNPVNNQLTFQSGNLGNTWGDFDNDGDEDVVITSDVLAAAGYYRNNGNGTFTKSGTLFSDFSGNVSGSTAGDYDGDGDLDLFALGGTQQGVSGRGLYKNNLSNGNHWLQIDLTGVSSNTTGIGAVVWLTAQIQGATRKLRREVSAQNTFMGHNAQRLHFGLEAAGSVDQLEIAWPSGLRETFDLGTALDTLVRLTEGQGTPVVSGVARFDKPGLIGLFPNPAGDYLRWTVDESADIHFEALHLSDLSGKTLLTRNGVDGSTGIIDLSGLPGGQYQLTLLSKHRRWVGRFQRL